MDGERLHLLFPVMPGLDEAGMSSRVRNQGCSK